MASENKWHGVNCHGLKDIRDVAVPLKFGLKSCLNLISSGPYTAFD